MALQRYYPVHKHRDKSFYDPSTKQFFSEKSGVRKNINTLQSALEIVDTPVLFLLPDSQAKYPNQPHYSEIKEVEKLSFLSKRKVAKLVYAGKKVDIYPLSIWFDIRPGTTLKVAIESYRILNKILDDNFQTKGQYHKIELLATPSQTGGDLLKRSLPFNKKYESIDHQIAEILLQNFGQGRFEVLPLQTEIINILRCYDGRWWYAACCRNLPTGPITHDNLNEIAMTSPDKNGKRGYIPGFYHVVVRVPGTWEHIGLLPMKTDERMLYPNQSGYIFNSWCGTPELSLAIQNGWQILEVKERILWFQCDSDPLRVWNDNLKRIRQEIVPRIGNDKPHTALVKSAIRRIHIEFIGSMCRTMRDHDVYVDSIEDIPIEYIDGMLQIAPNRFKYRVPEKVAPYAKDLSQIHWTRYLWSKARRNIAIAALQVPYEHIVAIRADAIWLDCEHDYIDDGITVGQLKAEMLHDNLNIDWPQNETEMRKLVQLVKG